MLGTWKKRLECRETAQNAFLADLGWEKVCHWCMWGADTLAVFQVLCCIAGNEFQAQKSEKVEKSAITCAKRAKTPFWPRNGCEWG
jgi:hypothetical protein